MTKWRHGLGLVAAMIIALGFASATKAQTQIDFETFPGGTPASGTVTTQYMSVGVVFNPGLSVASFSGEYGTTGNSVFGGSSSLTFAPAVSAVRISVGAINGNFTLRAFNSLNIEVDADVFFFNDEDYVDRVFEVTASDITRAELETSDGDIVVYDNLEFGTGDSDMDGTPDPDDGCPNDPAKIGPGICGCGVPESATDSDSDEVPDCIDVCPGDPDKSLSDICGCGVSDVDTDMDGTPDCNDDCPMDAAKTAAGVCGCGTEDVDDDNDETYTCQGDLCDDDPEKTGPGVCGCGTSDQDTDLDGTPDCNDMCITDPNKLAPGECGCGIADDDSDMDGTPDCTDLCDEDPNKIEPGVCLCGVPDDDLDMDGVLRCNDLCLGNDATGDTDMDGICNDRDDRVSIVTEEFTDARGSCPVGGVAITTGIDRNGDGMIDEEETYGTDYACTGPQGPEGRQVRFLSAIIAPEDPRCPEGGVELRLGIDDDLDGELDEEDEVDFTHNICRGQKTVAVLTPIDEGDETCKTGGVELSVGIDDNGNGELDLIAPLDVESSNEVDFTQKICNGLHSVVKLTPFGPGSPPAGAPTTVHCPTGGIHIAAGTDLNNDGELDDEEQLVEQNICNGSNSLILTSDIEPGDQCRTGGFLVRAGVDVDGDGELSGEELTSENTVCHGFNGIVTLSDLEPNPELCPTGGVVVSSGTDRNANGAIEDNERSSAQSVCHGLGTLVVTRSLEPDSEACPRGGTEIRTGIDDNGDGALDDDEVDSSQNVCAGLPSLSRTSAVEPNAQCPFGGAKLETGVDDDGDGTLNDSEVDATQVLCGGTGLAVRTSKLDVGSEACPAGGLQIETGIDANGNASLDDDEVQSSDPLCQPPALLFETETLGEESERCEHGGLRVFSGHDDGDPDGTPGDGSLQEGEIELDRDVCLAATDVLVNGGTGDCTVTTVGRRGNAWQALGLLLMAAVFAARRRKR